MIFFTLDREDRFNFSLSKLNKGNNLFDLGKISAVYWCVSLTGVTRLPLKCWMTDQTLSEPQCSLPSHKLRQKAVQSSTSSPLSSLTLITSICKENSACPSSQSVCPSLSSHQRGPLSSRLRFTQVTIRQELPETTWHFTVASRYFVPPAHTLLLNLCLHTRSASGKKGLTHLTFLKKHTPVPGRHALTGCSVRSLSGAWWFSVHVYDDGGFDACLIKGCTNWFLVKTYNPVAYYIYINTGFGINFYMTAILNPVGLRASSIGFVTKIVIFYI